MSNDRNSYSSITKSIGMFGGVRLFQILINVIRNKFVAIILGPHGMGIVGLITSSIHLITSCTNFGLEVSSVREISKAYSSKKYYEISERVTVLRRLVLLTGLLGTVVTFILAPVLSKWAFGDYEYTMSFRIVSVVLFLDQLWIGQKVLLQGTYNYRYMAKASLWGSVIGLFMTVPLYYVWKFSAIVPVIILTSVINVCLSTYYSRLISIKSIKMSYGEIFYKGREMLILGFAVATTGILNTGTIYLLRLVVGHWGNISDVGLYTAGVSAVNQYIGMILMSMASDYSPRLAAVSSDNRLFVETINRQMKLLVTLVTPFILIFILFIKEITILLYSSKFLPVTGMLEWMMIAMLFRAVAWSISFGYVAKGDAKLFFFSEVFTTIISLTLSILGYIIAGFEGMGVGFCINYMAYCIIHYLLSKWKYRYFTSKETLRVIIPQIVLSVIVFGMLHLIDNSLYRYVFGFMGLLVVCFISFHYLNEMINLKSAFLQILKKITHGKEI